MMYSCNYTPPSGQIRIHYRQTLQFDGYIYNDVLGPGPYCPGLKFPQYGTAGGHEVLFEITGIDYSLNQPNGPQTIKFDPQYLYVLVNGVRYKAGNMDPGSSDPAFQGCTQTATVQFINAGQPAFYIGHFLINVENDEGQQGVYTLFYDPTQLGNIGVTSVRESGFGPTETLNHLTKPLNGFPYYAGVNKYPPGMDYSRLSSWLACAVQNPNLSTCSPE